MTVFFDEVALSNRLIARCNAHVGLNKFHGMFGERDWYTSLPLIDVINNIDGDDRLPAVFRRHSLLNARIN